LSFRIKNYGKTHLKEVEKDIKEKRYLLISPYDIKVKENGM